MTERRLLHSELRRDITHGPYAASCHYRMIAYLDSEFLPMNNARWPIRHSNDLFDLLFADRQPVNRLRTYIDID